MATLLAVWPSQKIMEELICVTVPSPTKIIVLMRKDVFLQWNAPPKSGCENDDGIGMSRVRAVTGIRG
ncbi:hypothetical protein RAS12_00315 [Achromobacter seleniivolatilans]|uniref:Uncharacterized protein n=1 Tax=Achromobacter seleniivolatilans TaxID=3047478 RepID=A0ABY9M2C1_9BURK|nr:hypothetical protein [Achromobacter sp. R39]WMD20850.1 hypothetical protein RAS12_00315 [Achromobacter sp. R39]